MKTKKTIKVLMLSASVLFTSEVANAQWGLTGNPGATNASILGATSANINLRLFAGGAAPANERIRIAGSNGFVGIGTLAPTQRLHVAGNILATGGGSTIWNFASRIDGAFAVSRVPRYNGTEFINGTIFDNGTNVGIGNVAPTAKLHVTGTTRLQGATSIIGATAVTGNISSAGVVTASGGNSTNWNLAFTRVPAGTTSRVPRWSGTAYVAGTIFDNATNVGIGTTTPACKLAVANNSMGGIATVGSFQIGENNTTNLVLDNNEVQARANGAGSPLFLQFWGGDINACNAGGTASFNGPINAKAASFNGFTNVRATRLSNPPSSATENTLSLGNSDGVLYPGISLYSDATSVYTILYGKTTAAAGLQVADQTNAYADITASAFNVSSDRRMKKDIVDIDASQYDKYMNYIRNIESATFRYKQETNESRPIPHLGVIAQSLPAEVQAHISETPSAQGEGRLGVSLADMQGLLLVGVKAVDASNRALQTEVAELKVTVKNIETALASCCTNYSSQRNDMGTATEKAALEQNAPNPFSEETTIRFFLPSNSTAELKVMSLEGQLILSNVITKSGYGVVRITGSTMAAGTYTYTLLVDGKAVESKIMVLTR